MYKNYADRIANGSDHTYLNPGSRSVSTFHMEVNSKGYPALIKDGEHNLYDEIQSFADTCDLQNVLANFDLSTGVAPLSYDDARDGVVDFAFVNDSGAPSTLGNIFNDARACDDFFARLPLDVRKHFGHSVVNFERACCDGTLDKELRSAYNIPEKQSDVVPPSGVDVQPSNNVVDSGGSVPASDNTASTIAE